MTVSASGIGQAKLKSDLRLGRFHGDLLNFEARDCLTDLVTSHHRSIEPFPSCEAAVALHCRKRKICADCKEEADEARDDMVLRWNM